MGDMDEDLLIDLSMHIFNHTTIFWFFCNGTAGHVPVVLPADRINDFLRFR
jgi:hypothetical protein